VDAHRDIHLVLHGHFYQPPRYNPWLGQIEKQESARPYHDWNEKILTECYRPNTRSRQMDGKMRIRGLVNNLENISFNFGPTLLRYIEAEDPDAYRRILDADRESMGRRGGHGNAIAQAYHHVIQPLAPEEDRRLLIDWGLADFERRFGRKSEALWLPETAIHDETAADLARAGLRYVILSPHQADRFRVLGGEKWEDVSHGTIDPRRAYRLFPSPEESDLILDVFFYHPGLAVGISFEHYLRDAPVLAGRFLEAAGKEDYSPRLVHVATDGEVYGHHEPFADMCLAALFGGILEEKGIRVTNYGEFLEKNPPRHEVALKKGPRGEGTAWSCAHGVGRWCRDCGCSIENKVGWNQKWRAPLRGAMNLLRRDLGKLYRKEASRLLSDPWEALRRSIAVLPRGGPEEWREFLRTQTKNHDALTAAEEERIHDLLEMGHGFERMSTSCGWFFDDIAGIEASQNLLFAGHALSLARRIDGGAATEAEKRFRDRLRAARSNHPEEGDGQSIYLDRVRGGETTLAAWSAGIVLARLLGLTLPSRALGGRRVHVDDERRVEDGDVPVLSGTIRIEEESGFVRGPLKFRAERPAPFSLTVRLEPVEEGAPRGSFALSDVPRAIRSVLIDGMLEQQRAVLLAEGADLLSRLAEVLEFLERSGGAAPSWLRGLAGDYLARRFRDVMLRLEEAVERGEEREAIVAEAEAIGAGAARIGVSIDQDGPSRSIRRRAVEWLSGGTPGEREERAERVHLLLDEALRVGLSPEPLGAVQDAFFDRLGAGPAGPKVKALGLRIGFSPEILG